MNQHKVVLESFRSSYPFLTGDYAFDYRAGNFNRDMAYHLVRQFVTDYIQRGVGKKGDGESSTLEFLIKKLGEGCSGKDIFGTGDELTRVVDRLECGDGVELPISLVNVSFRPKRFGNCLGLQVNDASDNPHEVGFDIFEKMIMSDSGAGRNLCAFIRTRTVTMPFHWHWGGTFPDIATELAVAARYMPDIAWRSDADEVAEALLTDYVNADHQYGDGVGVEVGRYYDIPVYLRMVFGNEKTDRVWRKGSVDQSGSTLMFDNSSNGPVYMRYSCRIVDGSNRLQKAVSNIDYPKEQELHTELAELLLHGLSARYSVAVKDANPHHVAWRRTAE